MRPAQYRRLIVVALLLLSTTAARAESLGFLRLPENVAPLPEDKPVKLLDPPPASDAWATPDHHPLGITLNNYDLTEAQINAVRQTGCGVVRLYIPMEHFLEDNDSDWATLDQVISRLKRADLEVLAVLDAATPVREFYRPFCKSVATRYRESLKYYQILDDINYKIGISTRDYADLLAVCRPEILSADPDAVIVSGGIRGCDMTFLDMLENQHALNNLDVIALTLMPPADGIEQVSQLARSDHSLPLVQNVVDWASQRGKKVWVTSLGVSTDSTWVGVDQVTQASIYSRGALILGWMGVERVMLAQIQDNDPTYQIPADCCGLLAADGTPKASYYALTALASVVNGAYHATVPFACTGETFQQPAEADIKGIRDEQIDYSRRAFTGDLDPAESALAALNGPLNTFRTHEVEVFSYWFYAPASHEYRLVYWLTGEQPYPALLTLTCANARLKPFEKYLTPSTDFQLLDNAPHSIGQQEFFYAANMIFMEYLKLDTVPGVVTFKATENPTLQTASIPAPAASGDDPAMVSFRR